MTDERREAILALMAMPDKSDMPRRAHVVTQGGKPQRFELWARLPNVHAQYARQEQSDQSGVVRGASAARKE